LITQNFEEAVSSFSYLKTTFHKSTSQNHFSHNRFLTSRFSHFSLLKIAFSHNHFWVCEFKIAFSSSLKITFSRNLIIASSISHLIASSKPSSSGLRFRVGRRSSGFRSLSLSLSYPFCYIIFVSNSIRFCFDYSDLLWQLIQICRHWSILFSIDLYWILDGFGVS
jgi:hypothetical protein